MTIMSKDSIHNVLAQSYLSYFIFSIIGLFFDTLIGFNIHISYTTNIAWVCLFVGSILIAWAQYTSGQFIKNNNQNIGPYFHSGPYRFMRNPTHLGIVILVTGYTLISGSLIFFSITVFGYLISNVFFKKYESLLYTKYGDEYKEYENKVPKIF